MKLRPAVPADFSAIRAIAQAPEHSQLITDEDEAALLAYTQDPACRLYMVEAGDDPNAGYALYCELDNRAGAVELRRLALRDTGAGRGRDFVRFLTDFAFVEFGARRVWLDTGEDNLRAQTCYEGAGYQREGCLRQADYFAQTGLYKDIYLYGILRAEWQALRA
jgi:RimJ/RimL family protein N-acetyltransferase